MALQTSMNKNCFHDQAILSKYKIPILEYCFKFLRFTSTPPLRQVYYTTTKILQNSYS